MIHATTDDLWLPGDVLGGALLRGWIGPHDSQVHTGLRHEWRAWWATGGLCTEATRLDCTRPEVRDRIVRVLAAQGHDLLWLHAAELRGEITPDEAAGILWCSVLRVGAGLEAAVNVLDSRCNYGGGRQYVIRCLRDKTVMFKVTESGLEGWFVQDPFTHRTLAAGGEHGEAGVAAADAAALSAGYALREPGALLLPYPDGPVRLEVRP